MTKKQRLKLMSRHWMFRHIRPRVFNKLLEMNPYWLAGIKIPNHYG